MIPHLCPFELEIKMAEREGNSDSQELEDFISAQKSSNTVKKTKSDIRALKRFCSTIDETREPETMTAKELDKLLSRFLKTLRKKMAKSTSQVHSRHFKEASSATFLRRSYLSISLKMTSFPAAVRSSLQNERVSFKVVSATSQMLLGN